MVGEDRGEMNEDLLELRDLVAEMEGRDYVVSVRDIGDGCQILTAAIPWLDSRVGVGPFQQNNGTAAYFETLYYGDESGKEEGEPYDGAWNVEALADTLEGYLEAIIYLSAVK